MILQENSLTVTSVNNEVQYTFPDSVEARAVQIVLSHRGSDVTVRCSHDGRSTSVRPGQHDRVVVRHGTLTDDEEDAAQAMAKDAVYDGVLTVTRNPTLLEERPSSPALDPNRRDEWERGWYPGPDSEQG